MKLRKQSVDTLGGKEVSDDESGVVGIVGEDKNANIEVAVVVSEFRDRKREPDVVSLETEKMSTSLVGPEPFMSVESLATIEKKIVDLKAVIKMLNTKYTPESVVKTTPRKIIDRASADFWYRIEKIPTGVLSFDIATYGGVPVGKITEFVGDESSSKTTMALRACGKAQKRGLLVAFVDVEGTFDKLWAANFCDVDAMLLSQPESGEEALEIVDTLTRSGLVDLIIVDSIAAMAPRAEIDKTFDDVQVGALARLVNKAFRKWVSSQQYALRNHNTAVTIITIQQFRMKIGVMFGDPSTVPGGMAQRFAKSLSVKMWHGKSIEDKVSGKPLMIDMNFRVTKSKVCPPNMSGTYTMMLRNTEFLKTGDVFDTDQLWAMCLKYGFIEKVGKEFQVQKAHYAEGENPYLTCTKQADIGQLFLENKPIFEMYREEVLKFIIDI